MDGAVRSLLCLQCVYFVLEEMKSVTISCTFKIQCVSGYGSGWCAGPPAGLRNFTEEMAWFPICRVCGLSAFQVKETEGAKT